MKKYCILLYNRMWDQPFEFNGLGVPTNFFFTTDHIYIQSADVIVFHMPSLAANIDLKKREGQLWVFWSMECDVNYPYLHQQKVLQLFDIFMTYSAESDVHTPYLLYAHKDKLRQPPANKNNFVNAFISSSCNQSKRQHYLESLMSLIKIDSYGKLFNNKKINADNGFESKMNIISSYKFTLAFENAISKDYVTEKLYDPLMAGSVPVYMGAPNVEEYLPAHKCIINIDSFTSVNELAAYLQYLDENDVKYQAYLSWKQLPYKPEFLNKLEQLRLPPFIRLCDVIEKRIKK